MPKQNGGAGGGAGFVLSNSNGITFGTNGQTVTASVAGTVAGGTANINLSAGTTSNNSSAFVFSNSNSVSFGINAGTVTASIPAQTAQTVGVYGSSQTTGQSSSSTVDARSLSLVGAGGVSVGLSGGSVVISGATGGAAGGSFSAGISGGNTSGQTGTVSGQVVFAGGNNVTLSGSTNGASATVTISGPNTVAQTNQTLGLYAVSNTTQSSSGTVDARTLSVQGAGAISVGVSNGSLIVSAAAGAQSAQTLGIYGSSQTTGQSSSSTIDARSMTFVGKGILSVGMSAGSILLSTPDTTSFNAASVGISTNGNTAGNTGFGTDQVVFAGGANITLSGSTNAGSMTITISGGAGGAGYAAGVSTGGNTSNNTGVVTGQLVLAGGNNVTLSGSTNGGSATYTISAANQTNQSLGIYGSSQTTGQSSSSTVDARSLTFVGAGAASVGMSGGSVIISAQTVAGGNFTGGISGGNTSGNSGTVSGRMVMAGGNNITLSGSTNAGSISITVSAANQTNQSIGIYGSSQTTGQSSSSTVDARSLSIVAAGLLSVGMSGGSLIVSGPDTTSFNPVSVGFSTGGNTSGNTGFGTDQVVFAGGNNITLSGSTNAGSLTITISAGGGGGGFALSAGTQSGNTGTIVLSNSNGISFGMSGSTRVTASVDLTAQQISAFAVGNTTQSSSRTMNISAFSVNGAGDISAGISNGSIVISGTQTAQTVGLYASSQTTGQSSSSTVDARSLSIVGAGAASVGLSGGSFIVSVAAGGQSNQTLGLYGSSQTTGQSSSSTVDARSLTFVGAGAISVGLSGGSYIISDGGGGGAGYTAGLSNIGNTSGNTTAVTGRLILAGGNNVTLSGSSNAGSLTVTVSAANQTNQTVGLYAVGNTTQNSSTTLDARTISYNGLGAMTVGYSNGSVQLSAPASSSLSATGLVSISTNGSTISIGVPGTTFTRYQWPNEAMAGSYSSSTQQNSIYSIHHLSVLVPIQFTRVDLPVSLSLSSSGATNTAAIALSAMMVLYTRNGNALNPIVGTSASSTFSWASNTANWASITGNRDLSFALQSTLTPGEYWAGYYMSTTSGISTGANTTALNGTFYPLAFSVHTQVAMADFNAAVAASSNRLTQGCITSVVTNTTQTLQMTQMNMSGTAFFCANNPLMFRG